ncbi:MAG: ABC transporter ATP-binding protein [bacterium]|nr:ABC transporter ATP-binding protein [bacterium]
MYFKILRFLKPHWKMILLSVGLAVTYVTFNGISLWVSVDFIQELFAPTSSVTGPEAGVQATDGQAEPQSGVPSAVDQARRLNRQLKLTDRLKIGVKKLLVRPEREDTLKLVCLVIFISFLLKNTAFYLKRVVTLYIEQRVVTSIRDRVFQSMMRLPVPYFDNRHSGTLNSVIFNDVHAMNVVLNDSFGKLILLPIQTIGFLIILVSLSWKMSFITFLIVPVSGLAIAKIGQSVRRKSRRTLQSMSLLVAAFQESLSAVRIVKAFGGEEKERRRFHRENWNYLALKFRQGRLSYLTSPLNETFGALIIAALLWFGGRLVIRGQGLSPDDFVRYLVFLFGIFQPLKELSGINNTLQTGLAAAERIFAVIDEPGEIYEKPGAKTLKAFRRDIVYDHVSFRYRDDGHAVLHDVSLRVERGQTVAFVGPSGSGKTTLVNLLPRFYEVREGAVRIDGTDIRDMTLHSLRGQIGIVTQETVLFNDTVRANIAYGMDDADDARIRAAAEAANAWEFIRAMDGGLDARIGERGVNLSGGQKQRISIARAILRDPPILILDEATSALDTESERAVQEAIERIMKRRTVLVIAHRLSTVIRADRIVVMQKGRVLAQGGHRVLLRSCGLYRNLYEMQFQDRNARGGRKREKDASRPAAGGRRIA